MQSADSIAAVAANKLLCIAKSLDIAAIAGGILLVSESKKIHLLVFLASLIKGIIFSNLLKIL